VEVLTLAARPDLSDDAFDIPYAEGDGSAFMQGNMVATLTGSRRLAERWAEHVLVLVDDNRVVARAVSVPFSSSRDDRSAFPDGGWDQVAIWAAEDAIDRALGDVVCALEIAVDPTLRGQGLSVAAIQALKANVARLGFTRLVAPARPPGKSEHPFEPIDTYVLRRRPDGSAEDWWLRVHERAGGQFTSIARCSGTVQADLATWRRWTGLPFDTSGEVAVPGGLVPVMVSVDHNIGIYVEPNVWFDYPL
jgi:GNAT superfamily N-acetyltransferase